MYVKQCLRLGLTCVSLDKSSLRGLLMRACTIAFLLRMVVLNHLVSHSLVLHHSFTGLSVAFEQ